MRFRGYLIATAFVGTVASASAQGVPVQELACYKTLRGSPAIRPDGKIRFLLRSPTMDPDDDKSHDTVAIEPDRLPVQESLCDLTRAPNGAFAVGGLLVRFENGPRYSGRFAELGQAGNTFNAYMGSVLPNSIREAHAFEKRLGGLVSRGRMFGLDRYQHAYGIKDGKPTPYTTYSGAVYAGVTSKGHFVQITCVDFEIAKDIACHLTIQARERTILALVLPTENIGRWAEYSAIMEAYFEAHVEMPAKARASGTPVR